VKCVTQLRPNNKRCLFSILNVFVAKKSLPNHLTVSDTIGNPPICILTYFTFGSHVDLVTFTRVLVYAVHTHADVLAGIGGAVVKI
jgi:hypothetical protein